MKGIEDIQFSGLAYPFLNNIGDHIQSIATERLIPPVKNRFERDRLRHANSEKRAVVVMNGWFSHRPADCFPVSADLIPIFFGFHVTSWNSSWSHILSTPQCLEQFRRFGPIGCRDRYTEMRFRQAGIASFYSKCLTLTLPRRPKKPNRGWNVIVDVPVQLPHFVEDRAIRVSHATSSQLSETEKMRHAQDLLNFYRDNAKLVVTTRLHCALPCIGMGIPVIFLGSNIDYRTSILKDLRIPIYEYSGNKSGKNGFSWQAVDWLPSEPDIETDKAEIVRLFDEHLAVCLNSSFV